MSDQADHDALRRAYAAKALELHPDRLGDLDEAERARAEWKMAELNAAWSVLRDPGRRAAYDRTRRPGGPSAPGRGGAVGDGAVPAGVPMLEPEIEGEPTVLRRRRWSGHAPALIVGAVVVTLVVVTALALSVGEQPTSDVETADAFPVGACVVAVDRSDVTMAACNAEGAVRIVDKVPFPRPCQSGTAAVPLWEQGVSLCVID